MTTTIETVPQPGRPEVRVGAPPQPERRRTRQVVPSWGLKVAAAVTGSIWAIFLVIHLYGNLKVFMGGADAFNGYAHWLKEAFYPLFPHEGVLWLMRIVLGLALIVHVWAVSTIWWRGRKARGRVRARVSGAAGWGAYLMPVSGVLILLFLVYHILDMTLGIAPFASGAFVGPTAEASSAYENLVASFQRPGTAAFYIAVMLVLALHLAKGIANVATDLGAMGRRVRASFVIVGGLIALAILLGNSAIPVAVLLGVLS